MAEEIRCLHCGEKIRERRREPGVWEHAKTRATWCYNSTVATPTWCEPPVIVDGSEVPVESLDAAAHAIIHDPIATSGERGMANAILALIDDRRSAR